MILQQTLTKKEKIIGVCAIFFLLIIVMFGYNQTVIQPAQASVLHSEKIEEKYTARFNQLAEHFSEIRKNLNLVKSAAVKSKLRSIKECIIDAQYAAEKVAATEKIAAIESAVKIISAASVEGASATKSAIEAENIVVSVPRDIYADCEKLFIAAELELNNIDGSVDKIEKAVGTLEKNVDDYKQVVDQALDELKKKNDATLGTGGH